MTDRQTDAIERQLARGEPLSAAQAEHARDCPTCGATIAAAGRLDASLPNVVRRMVVEPLPAADELLRPTERRGPWRGAALLATAGAAAVLVAAVVVGGRLIGLSGMAPGSSGSGSAGIPQTGDVPDDMAAWVAEADASILDHIDRQLPASGLELVRLERCGDTALAFFADSQPSEIGPLLAGLGNYREPSSGASSGGVASSVDEPEEAYGRSQLEPCEVVVDTVLTHEEALAAYVASLAGNDRVRDPQVLATKMVTADIALAYLTEVQTDDGRPHQQVLVLRRGGGAWAVTGAQGGDFPVERSAVGVTPLGVAKGMPDDRWAAVGLTNDNGGVAVEIDFDGFPHRYPFSGGAFVIQLPADVGFQLPYRLLDADGNVISEGTSQP